MISSIQQSAQLEQLETLYAELTDGRPLIIAQEGARFVFEDGAVAASLEESLMVGRALFRFAANQLSQRVVNGNR